MFPCLIWSILFNFFQYLQYIIAIFQNFSHVCVKLKMFINSNIKQFVYCSTFSTFWLLLFIVNILSLSNWWYYNILNVENSIDLVFSELKTKFVFCYYCSIACNSFSTLLENLSLYNFCKLWNHRHVRCTGFLVKCLSYLLLVN